MGSSMIIVNEEKLSKFKKDNCKHEAKKRIANSDWSVLPDVNISNRAEFEAYRAQLRTLMFNPVESPVFPTEPDPIWL